MIWELASNAKRMDVTPEIVRSFNKMILVTMKLDPGVEPGEIRKHQVGVMRYRGAPPEDCEFLLGRLCAWLRDLNDQMPIYIGPIGKAVLLAVVAPLYIAWIHPFGDGNGRTARLVEFAILLEAGVQTPTAHLLSNHYSATRSEYYRQLDYASKSGGDIVPFISYAVQGFVDDLRTQIATVREQQLDVVWRNHVHESFRDDEDSPAKRRCKHLILDLAIRHGHVLKKDLTALSPRVVRDYHGKTDRTRVRDINVLRELDLIVFEPKKRYRARTEVIAAFLPGAKQGTAHEEANAKPSGSESRA